MSDIRKALEAARDALKANDTWHGDYDEHGSYPDSELGIQTQRALAMTESAIAAASPPGTVPSVGHPVPASTLSSAVEVAMQLAWAFRLASPEDRDVCKAALRAHLERLVGDGPPVAVAPWPDHVGQPITHGARLRHVDGTGFVAVRLEGYADEGDAWRAVYDDATVSRLSLQVGDKGAAVLAVHGAEKVAHAAQELGALVPALSQLEAGDISGAMKMLRARIERITGRKAEPAAWAVPAEGVDRSEPAPARDAHFGGSSYEASMLRDLLARILGDGGSYIARHGIDAAIDAALKQVSALYEAKK